MIPSKHRPARYVSHVVTPTDVQDGDTLAFRGLDGIYREGLVAQRAWEATNGLAWWVHLSLWRGNEVDFQTVLVAKTCCGSLVQQDPGRPYGTSMMEGSADCD